VVLTPLLDPEDIFRPSEIVSILLFFEPAFLAGGFAGLAADRFGTKLLPFGVARVRREEKTTVWAFVLSDSLCH
jgi:hypothetical protein